LYPKANIDDKLRFDQGNLKLPMRIASLVIGIIGSMTLVVICWLGLIFVNILHAVAGSGVNVDQRKVVAMVLPVLALLGAGTVMTKPIIGATLMAGATAGFLVWVGGLNFISMLPTLFLGVASLLGFLGAGEVKKS
jgi:hypothetical protein